MSTLPDSPSQCTTTEPTVSLSSSAVKKILWSPPLDHPTNIPRDPDVGSLSSDDATTSVLHPTFTFPDEILSEARALTSFAFSRAVQVASAAMHEPLTEGNSEKNVKLRPQPIISLYYPHSGCHDIIDSMVQYMAHDHGADILVLDSLEMALQESGAFGKEFAHAMDKLYKAPDTSDNDNIDNDDHKIDHDPMIQKIFDHIIDIPRESGANHDESKSVEQTNPRIVYMRDFGGIASSASVLVPYLLQALQTRRTAKSDKGSPDCAGPFQPTALVLGFSEPPNTRLESNDDSYMSTSCPCSKYLRNRAKGVSKGFATGMDLTNILPSLDNKLFALKNRTFPPSHFSSTFFLPSLTDIGELTTHRLVSKTPSIDNFMLSIVSMFVFTKDSDTQECRKIEQHMECNRKQAVRNAWLAVCLGRRGAVVSENPENLLSSILSDHIQKSLAGQESTSKSPDISEFISVLDDLTKRTGFLLPIFLDRIATLALGLSISQSSASTDAIQVTPPKVSEACQLLIKNLQVHSDWTKAVLGDEQDKKQKEEKEETADPIVQNVEKADDLNEYEFRLLSCIVDGAKLETRFSDICIPENIIDSLRTVISLPLLHPSAFKIGILGREAIGGVLLYGPPGTGKTLVCRALARECGARMLQLKPSDINDLYVGESEKLARATFTLAYRLAPCVIFIDEIDSLFKARTKDDRQYQRDLLNEFLQSMDGLLSAKKNKDSGVVVVGATNRPHDLDDAILRRLATRMMVDLPNEGQREQILRLHLRDEQLGEGVDLSSIARQTQHYSGSDLKALCVSAAMASVKDAIGDFSWTPHKPSESDAAVDIQADPAITPTVSDGAKSTFPTRIITPEHFAHAINEVSSSSSAGSHSELQRWHNQFGRKRTLGNRTKPQINGRLETRTHSGNDERTRYHLRHQT